MHKSEACCINIAFIIKDDVKWVLLTADTELLAALARNFDVGKGSHLVIEW